MNRREFFKRSAKTAAAIAIALNLGFERKDYTLEFGYLKPGRKHYRDTAPWVMYEKQRPALKKWMEEHRNKVMREAFLIGEGGLKPYDIG